MIHSGVMRGPVQKFTLSNLPNLSPTLPDQAGACQIFDEGCDAVVATRYYSNGRRHGPREAPV